MKKLLSILLCLAVVFSAIPVAFADTITAATSFSGGTGESGDPYQISTAAELMYFRDQINAGNGLTAYYKLTADIDLEGQDWTPIGTDDNVFKGNFAGNEHVISNITITNSATVNKITNSASGGTESWNTQKNFGFFASVEGTVTKLGLKNVTITPNGGYVGAFSAVTGYNSNISSCFVKNLSIKGYASPSATAGFSVRSYGQIVGCYIDGINAEINGGHFVPFAVQKGLNTWLSNSFVTNVSISTTLATDGPRVYTFGTCSQNNTLSNCYSTFDTSALSSVFREATNVSATYPSGTLVTSDALNSLDSSIIFTLNGTNPRYQVSKSGGAPLLLWEENSATYSMTVASLSGGTVEVSSESVKEGETVTVTATPAEGYKLIAITANGSTIATYNNVSDAQSVEYTPEANTEFSAVFIETDPALNPGLGRYVKPYTETITEFTANKSYASANNITFNNMSADANSTSAYMNLVTNASAAGSATLWIPTKQKALALKHTLEFDFKYDGMTTNSDANNSELVAITETFKTANDKLILKVSKSGVSDTNQYKLVLFDNSTNKQSESLKTLVKGTWYKFVLDVDSIVGEAKLTVYSEAGEEIGNIAYTSLSFKRDFEEMMSSISTSDSQFRPVALALNTAKDTIVNFRNIKTTQEMFEIPNAPTLALENATLKADLTAYYFDNKAGLENTLPSMYVAVYSEATDCLAKYNMVKQSVTMGTDFIKGNATAQIDLSTANLEDGDYTVKVFVWTDDCTPYTRAITKTLTVNGSNYNLGNLE